MICDTSRDSTPIPKIQKDAKSDGSVSSGTSPAVFPLLVSVSCSSQHRGKLLSNQTCLGKEPHLAEKSAGNAEGGDVFKSGSPVLPRSQIYSLLSASEGSEFTLLAITWTPIKPKNSHTLLGSSLTKGSHCSAFAI